MRTRKTRGTKRRKHDGIKKHFLFGGKCDTVCSVANGSIAQLGERPLDVREVMGSSPIAPIAGKPPEIECSGGFFHKGDSVMQNTVRHRNRRIGVCVLCAVLFAACTPQGAEKADDAASAYVTREDAGQSASSGESAKSARTADDLPPEPVEGADAVNRVADDLSFIRFMNLPQKESYTAEKNERAVVHLSYDLISMEKKASDGKTDLTVLSRKLAEQEYAREQERKEAFAADCKTADTLPATDRLENRTTQRLRVLRADTRVFSYMEECFVSVDGSSPDTEPVDTYTCRAFNLDAQSAKEIRLSDVVNDLEELSRLTAEAVLEKYDTTNPAYNASQQFEETDLQEAVLELFENGEDDFAWAPAYLGLRLVFARESLCDADSLVAYLEEASEINPQEMKLFDVTIPYTAAPLLFEPSYTELPASYIARIETGVPYQIDFGNGPEALQIATPRKYENNTVLYTGECTIRTGSGERQSFDLVGSEEYGNYGVCAYLVKQEDAFFLYLDATGKDETDRLHVYAIENGQVRFAGVSDEMLDNDHMPPFDPAHLVTEGIFYILPDPYAAETYTGNRGLRTGYVSGGGMPASDERFYDIAEEDVRLTAIALELDTLQDPDDVRPVKETYPAGTTLSMWRIERSSHADFRTDDGRMVRLYINGVDTIDLIDGHELHDAFADPRLAEGE